MFMGIQIEGRVWEVWLISVIIFVITGLILYQRKRSFSYLFFVNFLDILDVHRRFCLFSMAISGAFAEASRRSCPLPSN